MSRWTRLRQWPSRLGLKLFVAILSVNVAIAASVFLAVSYSIDRGFFLSISIKPRSGGPPACRWADYPLETQGDWALEGRLIAGPILCALNSVRSIVTRPRLGEAEDCSAR